MGGGVLMCWEGLEHRVQHQLNDYQQPGDVHPALLPPTDQHHQLGEDEDGCRGGGRGGGLPAGRDVGGTGQAYGDSGEHAGAGEQEQPPTRL